MRDHVLLDVSTYLQCRMEDFDDKFRWLIKQAYGLRDLFGRAVKGMVDRTVLRALVNEICNEELYRNIPKPEIVEVRQPIPTQSDLLQGVLAQVLKSLNINLNFNPPQPQEPIQTVPVESLPVHTLSETCELYLKEKETGSNVNP